MSQSRRCRNRVVAIVVVTAAAPMLFTPSRATAAAGTTTRASVASDGTQGDQASPSPDISADGRYVAFTSDATNLVPGDTNGVRDIFVHERHTGAINRVSVASDGTQGDGHAANSGLVEAPAISADGRFVAFSSNSNLVLGGAGGVYVHDRTTGVTSLVSIATDGTPASGVRPAISADGRFVAFESGDADLVDNDANNGVDVFVHDRQDGSTIRVSVASDGREAISPSIGGGSNVASTSADGRYVAFDSIAVNLVPGDTNLTRDVFVHDRLTQATTRVSLNADGSQRSSDASFATISGDGRYVAFESSGAILVHDRLTGATPRVDVSSTGQQANSTSTGADISNDGRFVSFTSFATNLVPTDARLADVYVRDRLAGTTSLANLTNEGLQPMSDGETDQSRISGDGRVVVFHSGATDLVPGDTNEVFDTFVRDRGKQAVPLASVGDVAVHEGHTGTRAASFTVSLSRPAPFRVSLAYTTVDYSAVAPGDYAAKSGTVSFPPGVASQTVKIPVAADTADEDDEMFAVALSSSDGWVGVADATGVATIVDDDPGTGRSLAIGNVSVHEGDAGARSAVFNVSLSKPGASWVYVSYATVKGTATGSDFTAKSGTLGFAPGTTTMNVKVAITADTIAEGNEVLMVKLSSSNGASITDAVGTGTITDDD